MAALQPSDCAQYHHINHNQTYENFSLAILILQHIIYFPITLFMSLTFDS